MGFPGGNILSLLDTGPDIQTRQIIIGGAAATAAVAVAAICLAQLLHHNPKPKGAKMTAAAVSVAAADKEMTSSSSSGSEAEDQDENAGLLRSVLIFAWACFFKPHEMTGACAKGGASQQDALESFYKKQAKIYDKTRKTLLKGREDMLALVAAQLEHKAKTAAVGGKKEKRIWVDVGLTTFLFYSLFFSF